MTAYEGAHPVREFSHYITDRHPRFQILEDLTATPGEVFRYVVRDRTLGADYVDRFDHSSAAVRVAIASVYDALNRAAPFASIPTGVRYAPDAAPPVECCGECAVRC